MNSTQNILDFIEYLTYRLRIKGDTPFIILNKENIDSFRLPINELILLLKQLKKSGVVRLLIPNTLYNWEKSLQKLGDRDYLKLSIDGSALKQYRQSLTQKEPYNSDQVSSKKIKDLIFVKPDYGSKCLLVVNQDYINPQMIDLKDKGWDLLFQLASKKTILASEVDDYRNRRTFLNSHKENRLYGKAGFKPTKIVTIKDGEVSAMIPLVIISKKAYTARKNSLERA